jgi:hypothetical protein
MPQNPGENSEHPKKIQSDLVKAKRQSQNNDKTGAEPENINPEAEAAGDLGKQLKMAKQIHLEKRTQKANWMAKGYYGLKQSAKSAPEYAIKRMAKKILDKAADKQSVSRTEKNVGKGEEFPLAEERPGEGDIEEKTEPSEETEKKTDGENQKENAEKTKEPTEAKQEEKKPESTKEGDKNEPVKPSATAKDKPKQTEEEDKTKTPLNAEQAMSEEEEGEEEKMSEKKKERLRKKKEREWQAGMDAARERERQAKGIFEKVGAKMAKAKLFLGSEFAQKITSQLLKGSWKGLFTSFGLTYIYIFIHFAAHYLGHFKAFDKPGREWIPEHIRKTTAGKSMGFGLVIAEAIVFGLITVLLTLILILAVILLIVFFTWAVCTQPATLVFSSGARAYCTNVLNLLWDQFKSLFS